MNPLSVYLHLRAETAPLCVGRLAYQSGLAYLELDKDWVARGINISPVKLQLTDHLQEAPRVPFNGLHGVFADSLPDGWGLLLMDRWLRKHNIHPGLISPVERLAYMGDRGMGALTYQPDQGFECDELQQMVSIAELAADAQRVFQGSSAEVTRQLYMTGGSPGGARPKAALGLKGNEAVANTGSLPQGYEHWLVKFPAGNSAESRFEGVTEYIYSVMARQAGIEFADTRLIEAASSETAGQLPFFASKRFDRDNHNRRIHMHSLAGLVHADFRLPDSDYELLMKVTAFVTKSHQDMVEVLRRMIFNILAGNRDDHTKNFSFLMTERGEWSLSPAYDVTFNTGINGHHSMSIHGEGVNVSRQAIQKIADLIPLPSATVDEMIAECAEALSAWAGLARQYAIPLANISEIQAYIETGVRRIRY